MPVADFRGLKPVASPDFRMLPTRPAVAAIDAWNASGWAGNSTRGGLTPMTTGEQPCGLGARRSPAGRGKLNPLALDIASGGLFRPCRQSLDPSPPSAQHPGAGHSPQYPTDKLPLGVTTGAFSRPAQRGCHPRRGQGGRIGAGPLDTSLRNTWREAASGRGGSGRTLCNAQSKGRRGWCSKRFKQSGALRHQRSVRHARPARLTSHKPAGG
jgi:hypothetical protein